MIDTLTALAARWRAQAMAVHDIGRAAVLLDCAADLEAVLPPRPGAGIEDQLAAERERIARLAEQHGAVCARHPGSPLRVTTTGTVTAWEGERLPEVVPFAALVRAEPPPAAPAVQPQPTTAERDQLGRYRPRWPAATAAAEWVHLAGTPWHEEEVAERYPGRAASSDLSKVTCPACLLAAPDRKPPGHAQGDQG